MKADIWPVQLVLTLSVKVSNLMILDYQGEFFAGLIIFSILVTDLGQHGLL